MDDTEETRPPGVYVAGRWYQVIGPRGSDGQRPSFKEVHKMMSDALASDVDVTSFELQLSQDARESTDAGEAKVLIVGGINVGFVPLGVIGHGGDSPGD